MRLHLRAVNNRGIISVAVALLTGLTLTPAHAAVTDNRIAIAEASARAGAARPEGRKFEEIVGQAFGRERAATVAQCARSMRRPELSDFDLFLRVNVTGTVEESLAKPTTNLADCVRSKLVGWRVPAPPRAGHWVKVGVKLRR